VSCVDRYQRGVQRRKKKRAAFLKDIKIQHLNRRKGGHLRIGPSAKKAIDLRLTSNSKVAFVQGGGGGELLEGGGQDGFEGGI